MEVAALGPRIREVDADARKRLGRDPIEEREQVAVDDTDVVESTVFDRVEHGDHTGRVDLDADHVELRLGCGHLDRRLAVTEPDVEHDVTGRGRTPRTSRARDRRGRDPTRGSTRRTRLDVSVTANGAEP